MIQSYAKTHIGQRKINEDAFSLDDSLNLYVIADGVGGHQKGEIASQMACQSIFDNVKSGLSLSDAVYTAHRKIISEIKADELRKGMATTVVAVIFDENIYEVVWVGDSRVYLWDGSLKLITKDDSYIELLLENGHINIDDLATHPDRNVISQALGMERKNLYINTNKGTLQDDEILLICTDGLYNIADELDMIRTLKQPDSLQEMTDYLIKTAVNKEGKDNITLGLIKNTAETTYSNFGIKPKIYRRFNSKNGKPIHASDEEMCSRDTLTNEEVEDTDPESIDQTAYRDLTEEQRNLIETAAQIRESQEPKQSTNITLKTTKSIWLPVASMLITVIIIGYFLFG